MSATALVLLIPESEPLVGGWRKRFDPVAAQGMPAHVTVLYPFMDEEAIDPECLAQLDGLFAEIPAPALTFRRTGRFPNALWLAPEPAGPVKAITQALVAAFPDYPPYGGAFPDSIPHLTVAQGAGAVVDEAEAGLSASFTEPIVSRIVACSLFAFRDGRWRERKRFDFAA